jgi:predicted transcriptional regulator
MIEQIKNMVEEGYSIKRISSILNLTTSEIKKEIENNNFELKKLIFSEDQIPYIRSLYLAGVSAKILGKKYSIDKRRIQKWANEIGALRSVSDSRRITNFNQNIFDEINTPGKAYWLGMLYSDAYNCLKTSTVILALNGNDVDHIKKLAKFVDLPESKVKKYIRNCDNANIAELKMYSKHLCETLSKHGCMQGKSLIVEYPKWLSEELNVHFIRGLFDGDGCITKRNINKEWKFDIAGTLNINSEIKNIIFNKLNLNIAIYPQNNIHILETSGNQKISQILDWLYADSTEDTRLDRKYEKYLELKEQQSNRKSWHASV